jgi:hypothetical protein
MDMKAGLIEGNNSLRLCPAAMCSIMQAWLDHEMVSPTEVTSVDFDSAAIQFIVKFKRAEKDQPHD